MDFMNGTVPIDIWIKYSEDQYGNKSIQDWSTEEATGYDHYILSSLVSRPKAETH